MRRVVEPAAVVGKGDGMHGREVRRVLNEKLWTVVYGPQRRLVLCYQLSKKSSDLGTLEDGSLLSVFLSLHSSLSFWWCWLLPRCSPFARRNSNWLRNILMISRKMRADRQMECQWGLYGCGVIFCDTFMALFHSDRLSSESEGINILTVIKWWHMTDVMRPKSQVACIIPTTSRNFCHQ